MLTRGLRYRIRRKRVSSSRGHGKQRTLAVHTVGERLFIAQSYVKG